MRARATLSGTAIHPSLSFSAQIATAAAVSDPRNGRYTDYLTAGEVDAMTQPKASDVAAVVAWLRESGNVAFTMPRPGGHLIDVVAPVKAAEALLGTKWTAISNRATGQTVQRAGSYTIPAKLGGAIAAAFGLHGLPLPPKTVLFKPAAGAAP